jgi:hypothetical protein
VRRKSGGRKAEYRNLKYEQSGRRVQSMSSSDAKKNLNIWLIPYLILLLIVIAAGWFVTGYLGDKARQEIFEYNDKVM